MSWKAPTRRKVMTLGAGACLIPLVSYFASEPARARMGSSYLDGLIAALRATRKAVCLHAASSLVALPVGAPSYDLHLRRAELTLSDVTLIAGELFHGRQGSGPQLHSLSMSYNPEITDMGVTQLVRAFPPSLTELGLVGCQLTDEAGVALLSWCESAPYLRLICVEQNHFSRALKERLQDLTDHKKFLNVVV